MLADWVVKKAKEVGVELNQLGVRDMPDFKHVVASLEARPPSLDAAPALFEWLHDHQPGGVTAKLKSALRVVPFIPVGNELSSPQNVFVPHLSLDDDSSNTKKRAQVGVVNRKAAGAPATRRSTRSTRSRATSTKASAEVPADDDCDLGLAQGQSEQRPELLIGLARHCDFGPKANTFLHEVCEVATTPSPDQLASLLIERRDAWMKAHDDDIDEYIELLKIYIYPAVARMTSAAKSRLKNARVLLAVQKHVSESGVGSREQDAGGKDEVHFAKAADIVIADDPNLAALLNPLVPASDDLEVHSSHVAFFCRPSHNYTNVHAHGTPTVSLYA